METAATQNSSLPVRCWLRTASWTWFPHKRRRGLMGETLTYLLGICLAVRSLCADAENATRLSWQRLHFETFVKASSPKCPTVAGKNRAHPCTICKNQSVEGFAMASQAFSVNEVLQSTATPCFHWFLGTEGLSTFPPPTLRCTCCL